MVIISLTDKQQTGPRRPFVGLVNNGSGIFLYNSLQSGNRATLLWLRPLRTERATFAALRSSPEKTMF